MLKPIDITLWLVAAIGVLWAVQPLAQTNESDAAGIGELSVTEHDALFLQSRLENAVRTGNEELVRHILGSTPQPDRAQRAHPLVLTAVAEMRFAIVQLLVAAGYDLYATDRHGRTALHVAAYDGMAESVAFLLDVGFVQVDAVDRRGQTALNLAVARRRPGIVEQLLAGGADPALADDSGRAPLELAVTKRYDEIVTLLLRHGADTGALFEKGKSTFRRALEKDHLDIAEALAASTKGDVLVDPSALHSLISAGRLGALGLLARAGFNLDQSSSEGHSALAYAVQNQHPYAIQTLLASGADPNSIGRYGRSMLNLSVECRRCLALLVEAGADVNFGGTPLTQHQNLAVYPPLTWAILHRRTASVRALLRAGANVSLADSKNGRAPITQAARMHGMTSMVRLLVEHGADPNAADAGQWPTLLHAVSFSDQSTVRVLLELGAKVNAPNGHGWTPLMSAVANGDVEMMELLMRHGARLNDRSRQGWTALSEAHHYGHFDLTERLEQAGAIDPVNPPMRTAQDRGKITLDVKALD